MSLANQRLHMCHSVAFWHTAMRMCWNLLLSEMFPLSSVSFQQHLKSFQLTALLKGTKMLGFFYNPCNPDNVSFFICLGIDSWTDQHYSQIVSSSFCQRLWNLCHVLVLCRTNAVPCWGEILITAEYPSQGFFFVRPWWWNAMFSGVFVCFLFGKNLK